MTQNLYHQGIESLKLYSDEKQVYINKFTGYIEEYGVASLLDIGAGDGEVALPISEQVDTYVAIERDPRYASILRGAGKKVIEHSFPTEVGGRYDMVIMSHIISHNIGNHTTLVPPAWDLVNPGGHLLIVTHRDVEQDAWGRLLNRIGLGFSDDSTTALANLTERLRQLGTTDIERVSTTLSADSVPKMLQAMAFLAASGGQAYHDRFMEKADQVSEVLEKSYQQQGRFIFPITHPFMCTEKPLD